ARRPRLRCRRAARVPAGSARALQDAGRDSRDGPAARLGHREDPEGPIEGARRRAGGGRVVLNCAPPVRPRCFVTAGAARAASVRFVAALSIAPGQAQDTAMEQAVPTERLMEQQTISNRQPMQGLAADPAYDDAAYRRARRRVRMLRG